MSTSPQKLIEELQQSGSLKVWSLIITFFGDAVEPRGGVVAASTLQAVMQVMGVGSGAVRTACSRLAKDGWIERQKQGRNSFYRLSDMGHTPFKQASRQIYAAPPVDQTTDPGQSRTAVPIDKFTLVIQNPLNSSFGLWKMLCEKGIRINGNSVLFESGNTEIQSALANSSDIEDMLILTDATASFPDWIKRSVCPDNSAQRYHQLMQRFDSIPHQVPADPLISLAVRCLLIHEWRRLLLRNTPVPAALVPLDWPHNDCHQFVAKLYQEIFATGEQWMDNNALGPNGPLQTTDRNSTRRFSSNKSASQVDLQLNKAR